MIVNSINAFSANGVNYAPKKHPQVQEPSFSGAEKLVPAPASAWKAARLAVGVAAAITAGSVLVACGGSGGSTLPITNSGTEITDPIPDSGVVLSEDQAAIMNNLILNAKASNAIIETEETGSASLISSSVIPSSTTPDGIAKSIYMETSDVILDLELDEEQLITNPNQIVYKGTLYDKAYEETKDATRIYYKTDDPNIIKYKDSSVDSPMKEVNKGTYYEWYNVVEDVDTPYARKTPITTTPGKIAITNFDGSGPVAYITDYTLTVKK